MLQFFANLFGGRTTTKTNPVRPSPRPRTRLGVEELTPRIMPSASPFGLAGGHFAGGFRPADVSSSSSTSGDPGCPGPGSSAAGAQAGQGCTRGATLFANLSDSNGATGLATYNAATSTLTIKISGATVSTSLTVTVNGTTVGTVSTDASGNGYAKLTNVTATAGQTITVGDLQGTLAQANFTAPLTSPTSATGVSGTADFNAIQSKLFVVIQGAAASTVYNVTVDGVVVGTLTTNSSGFGRLHLTLTNSTIAAGSTITISDTAGDPAILTGTFA